MGKEENKRYSKLAIFSFVLIMICYLIFFLGFLFLEISFGANLISFFLIIIFFSIIIPIITLITSIISLVLIRRDNKKGKSFAIATMILSLIPILILIWLLIEIIVHPTPSPNDLKIRRLCSNSQFNIESVVSSYGSYSGYVIIARSSSYDKSVTVTPILFIDGKQSNITIKPLGVYDEIRINITNLSVGQKVSVASMLNSSDDSGLNVNNYICPPSVPINVTETNDTTLCSDVVPQLEIIRAFPSNGTKSGYIEIYRGHGFGYNDNITIEIFINNLLNTTIREPLGIDEYKNITLADLHVDDEVKVAPLLKDNYVCPFTESKRALDSKHYTLCHGSHVYLASATSSYITVERDSVEGNNDNVSVAVYINGVKNTTFNEPLGKNQYENITIANLKFNDDIKIAAILKDNYICPPFGSGHLL